MCRPPKVQDHSSEETQCHMGVMCSSSLPPPWSSKGGKIVFTQEYAMQQYFLYSPGWLQQQFLLVDLSPMDDQGAGSSSCSFFALTFKWTTYN